MPEGSHLEDQILAALERALAEGRLEAAEHLLRALEALCEDGLPGASLAVAHLVASEEGVPKRSGR